MVVSIVSSSGQASGQSGNTQDSTLLFNVAQKAPAFLAFDALVGAIETIQEQQVAGAQLLETSVGFQTTATNELQSALATYIAPLTKAGGDPNASIDSQLYSEASTAGQAGVTQAGTPVDMGESAQSAMSQAASNAVQEVQAIAQTFGYTSTLLQQG
jgi:hypothetical protein